MVYLRRKLKAMLTIQGSFVWVQEAAAENEGVGRSTAEGQLSPLKYWFWQRVSHASLLDLVLQWKRRCAAKIISETGMTKVLLQY